MSIKWLRRIRVASEPAMTRWETSSYTESMPDGTARQFTFVMEASRSLRIPRRRSRPDERLCGDQWHRMVWEWPYQARGRVNRRRQNWRQAELQEPILNRALTRFKLPWQWNGEQTVVMSRAMDETGYVQPTHAQLVAVRGTTNRYHYNAIQPWQIAADGKVTNVLA